jgi:predicted AlkP superfamily phosphohydrolase/phosphomutase
MMRRWWARGLLVAALALLGLWLFVFRDSPPPPPATGRLIVIGFDGMDPNLAERWMDDGHMPEFARLRAEGYYQHLATSNPPQSPVAWSSFATGSGAGDHGIFDFLRRDPLTYHPDFSIARYTPPEHHLSLGSWSMPIGDGLLENLRQGEPFWMTAQHSGRRSTVQRVPVTYPPDPVEHMLSGMGVPDLRGTQGTYTLFSTRRMAAADNGGRVVRVQMDAEGQIETALEGPAHPLKPDAPALSLPLKMTARTDGARVELGEETRELVLGEWSDWWPVHFSYGLGSIPGMLRMRLTAGFPRPLLYVSPIQADPSNSALPLSAPPEYAAELAERIGRFHTLGMPEETWSLNQGHLDEAGYLDMVRTTLAEGEGMLYDAMARNDSELIVNVFVQTDRVSHMFWRGLDETHPLHAESSELARGAIAWIYAEADRVLGEVRRRMGPNDQLIVLSDHGFSAFRRAVHVNRWLVDHGYLVLKAGKRESEPLFADVDWSRSRAYALGLNGLFVNLSGREGQGMVSPEQREALLAELSQALAEWRDADGSVVVQHSYLGSELYAGAHNADAPDLVLGYAPGFRASWQTTLGAVPKAEIEDNLQFWSGDHCIDPLAVPGVLFTTFAPQQPVADIAAMAHFVIENTPNGPTP